MMKHLPNTFQFRIKKYPGFTHLAKLNGWGDYEVKWARGYAEEIKSFPSKIVEEWNFQNYFADGQWMFVEDKPKQKEQEAGKLPNEFYFTYQDHPTIFKAKLNSVYPSYDISWDNQTHQTTYSQEWANTFVKGGEWKLCDAPVELTREQEATIKQYREQQAQLDSSIRIQEQTVEHHIRMIANYKQRQEELEEMICKITGEESPKIVKAKAMKAELERLKGGNSVKGT